MGAKVRGPWFIVRCAVEETELLAWYDAGMEPAFAAERISRAWFEQTRNLTAMLPMFHRIEAKHGDVGAQRFRKMLLDGRP